MLNIGGIKQPPEWSGRYQLPEEEAVLSHLESLEAEKQEIEERIRLGEERLRDEQHFKRLLYEQHTELETTVWEALEELGATVHRLTTKNEEDGRLEDPRSRPAMLEIKGRRGSLKLEEVRQLHDWMENAYHNEEWEGKGIVVGNAYLLEEPDARPEPFPDNCVRAAERYGLCLLTSKQLFDEIGAKQNGQWDQERFWDSVFETDGVWRRVW